ncbi:uncharacterized protein LOC128951414 [Oppia nitens]|uniref:uncharacterized protein LOC128951414 n=1 Tax=Oppia nitens TaxID=1686743 RepID=UPI0023DB8A68|nr:uncharacterized protein LOC128951414 [Oppia nitens]
MSTKMIVLIVIVMTLTIVVDRCEAITQQQLFNDICGLSKCKTKLPNIRQCLSSLGLDISLLSNLYRQLDSVIGLVGSVLGVLGAILGQQSTICPILSGLLSATTESALKIVLDQLTSSQNQGLLDKVSACLRC